MAGLEVFGFVFYFSFFLLSFFCLFSFYLQQIMYQRNVRLEVYLYGVFNIQNIISYLVARGSLCCGQDICHESRISTVHIQFFFINNFSPSDLISCQTIQVRQKYRGIDSHIHQVALCGNECRCKTFCHFLMVTVKKNSIVISC